MTLLESRSPTSPRVRPDRLRSMLKGRLRTIGPFVIIPILVGVFEGLNPRFLTGQNLANIGSDASTLMVLAIAQTFVILAGSIDLSIASIVTVTGVTGATLIPRMGAPAILLILLIGVGAGAVNGFLFAWGRLPSFLVTLGTMYAFNGVALYITNGASIALPVNIPLRGLFGGTVAGFPAISVWALATLAAAIWVAKYTRFGRYAYVIGGGESVAQLGGVPVRRYKLYIFLLAGFLGALGGLLLMYRDYGGDPTMGSTYLLPMIAAVVMGGTPLSGGLGGPFRTLLGVVIISMLTNGMVLANVQPYLQIVVEGVVVVGAVALAIDRRHLRTVK